MPPAAAQARELLRSAIDQFVRLSDASWPFFSSELTLRRVRRGGHLLRAGSICGEVAFVAGGLFRTYVTAGAGEVNCDLRREGEFVTDYVSFLTGRPSDFSIAAVEDATVLTLSRPAMERLYAALPEGERLGRRIAEELFVGSVARTVSLLLRTPGQRYEALASSRPELLQRVPQYQLASYLGVAPETLSRLRARRARSSADQRIATGTSRRPAAKSKAPTSKSGGPKSPRAPREKP